MHLGKPGEDQPNRLTHAQIRIHLICRGPLTEPNGYREDRLAPVVPSVGASIDSGRRSDGSSYVIVPPGAARRSFGWRGSYVPSSSTITVPTKPQVERRDRLLMHLFQHQIHHRGQVHAMLSGTRIKPPQLDEFFSIAEAPLRASEFAGLGWTEETVWGP